MRRLYKKFSLGPAGAPYVGVWLFWRPAVVINSPELARRILVRDSDNFRNRFLSSGKHDPIGALNLLTVNDPLWSVVRRRLSPMFTAARLRPLEGLVRGKAGLLVERYRREMADNPAAINVRVINTDYTTDLIGEATFGVRCEATRTGDSIIRKITRDFMEFSIYRGINWTAIFFCPSLVDVFRFSMFPKKSTQLLRRLFRAVTSRRGPAPEPGAPAEPRDFLHGMRRAQRDAAGEGDAMDEDLMLAQAAGLLQAGFDTSGSGLTWLFKELAHSPNVQEKLHRVLVEARESLGRELDDEALGAIPYLNATIKEGFRKYPAMGWFDRVAAAPYSLDERCTLPAGTPVYVNTAGMASDPEHFPAPGTFDPERFMPGNEQNIKPYTFMPFGEGPRSCIGVRFAYTSMRYALSSVVLNFELRAPADAPLPNQWPGERRGMFFMPAGEMNLHFIDRNSDIAH